MAFCSQVRNLCNKYQATYQRQNKESLTTYPVSKAKPQWILQNDSGMHRETARTPLIISSSPVRGVQSKGSLTVEASLLLPLFLIFFLHILSALQFLSCYGRMEAALHQTGKRMSVYAYLNETSAWEEGGQPGQTQTAGVRDAAAQAAGILYARQEVQRCIGKDNLKHLPILRGQDGIYYGYSALPDEDQCIDLAAVYQVKPMLALPGVMDIRLINRCRMRTWTGFQIPGRGSGDGDESSVYVTEYGSVFHLSASCTHIRLSVREVAVAAVPGMRNAGGSKYYLCEVCGSQTPHSGRCYLTLQGNRYHCSLSCGGLKRSVRSISRRAAEAQGMRACSRCG